MVEDPKPELRRLYRSRQGKAAFFDMLATYTNRVSEISAENAATYTDLEYDMIVEIFRELEALKIGTFKVGRRGKPTRIVWNYSPKSVGEVASGAAMALDSYVDGATEESEPTPTKAVTGGAPFKESQQIIEEAKRELAAKLGVAPAAISITIAF